MLALESMGKDPLEIGKIPPTPELVNQYFNDSTGKGDFGDADARGPWNEGNGWEFVESPAFDETKSNAKGTRRPAETAEEQEREAGSSSKRKRVG